MNGDTIPMFARDAGKHFFEHRYSIALWWWEVGVFPKEWHQAFEYLDEIWVASDHIYKTIAAVSPIPVFKVPMPVIVPRVVEQERVELGMPEGTFTFLFMYDYHSTSARKNPVGLVKAFRQAFPPGSGASLVLKCINAESLPAKHEEVLVAARDHRDIHIVDRYVSAAQKDAMVAACDCYVSLHRSEGFGLTPAEAMWLGKPVIATRYGGTLEFMTPENSYLVDHEPAPVGDGAHPYPADAIWADPDLDQAAELMRHVFDHQDEARARGRRAYKDIRHTNSPDVAGAVMENRLQTIFENVSNDPSFDLGRARRVPALELRDLPKFPGVIPRLKRLVKWALYRVKRRMHRRQRAIDTAVAAVERNYAAKHAETLGGFRRTRSELDDVRRQLSPIEPRLKHHLDEHRALPYIAEDLAFQTWIEPQAGAVFGFRDAMPSPDVQYRAFTDAFRGSQDHVKDIQRPYVDLFAGNAPVLDVGCGRGELLDLLAER
ncbi:MAG: glycosyltransferase family 4 protein, partial [Phycisphaerales bacterium]|nr:glycosyltransferase family 4 protein [Phycisphaerales bacterium]